MNHTKIPIKKLVIDHADLAHWDYCGDLEAGHRLAEILQVIIDKLNEVSSRLNQLEEQQ